MKRRVTSVSLSSSNQSDGRSMNRIDPETGERDRLVRVMVQSTFAGCEGFSQPGVRARTGQNAAQQRCTESQRIEGTAENHLESL